MFSRTGRTLATVIVALTVVLSMAAGPAMAAQDDGGLLGGDDSDDSTLGGDSGIDIGTDGVSVGGDSGVGVGTDGVSVGGDSGVNVSTDGVSAVGQEVGPDAVSDGGDSTSLPGGDDALIGTDGSNVEVGGDSGISVGTDGVSVGGGEGVNVGPEGVNVAGQDVGSGQPPGGDGLPGGDVAPGGGSGDVPTGPLPVDVSVMGSPMSGGLITVQSADNVPGPKLDATLFSDTIDDGGVEVGPRLDVSDANRTYIDFDGTGRVTRSGLQNAEGAIYTVNESGGTYILALSRDNVQAAGMADAQGERIGVVNVQNTPGTQEGIIAGGLFPAAIAGLGPSAPVGPEAPEKLGGGIKCDGDRCVTDVSGINETLPSNRVTDPIKQNYPFPRTTDTTGTVLPCSKPVTPDDLPTEELPGLSDLPNTGAGLPTSLLTNEAVLSLAFGVTPTPCEVSDPIADPIANPAVEPGEYEGSPTVDLNQGSFSTDNGLTALRAYELGPGNGAGTADGLSFVKVQQDEQRTIQRLDVSDSEYEYLLITTRGEQENETVAGEFDSSLRDGYAGVGGDLENELGTGNATAGLTVSVVGNEAGASISCTPSGCKPGYEGLPKFGDFPPELPNPLAGDAGLPA
jgi:hypothetical protein